ncbi:hypothetical protein ACQ4PT_004300 [Festuca glaucescens]
MRMWMQVIREDTIDGAVERILDELKNTSSRENAIYFDGWDGLGTSAVLRAVAQRLSSKEPARPPGLEFEEVIHIDYSKWKSRRALQREITEQLELPSWVMKVFDKQDEDDDFNGIVDQGPRTEIEEVTAKIHRSMESRRFLLILHNGHNEEIDIFNLGLNLGLSRYGYPSNKMLWTFQGRFRLDPRLRDMVVKSNTTDVLISASPFERDPQDLWSYLLREEAEQVSCKHGIDPAMVVECFSYMLERSYMGQNIIDYDWAFHASNFWICDGIIQQEQWQLGNALHEDLELCIDKLSRQEAKEEGLHKSHMKKYANLRPYWISTASCGFVLNPVGIIPNNMFQNSDELSVIKLSQCAFSFLLPPFLYCHSLRFLCLDRCKNLQRNICAEEGNDSTRVWACFQSLWILDLRYMDMDWILSAQMMDLMTQLIELNIMGAENWDMSHLRGRLRNIRKPFKVYLLRLKSVIVDGSDGLEKISLLGFSQLKNVLLRGLLKGLEELDLSGTTLHTIDLGATCCLNLKRFLLLGCEELRAVLWPPKGSRQVLDVLRIDTTSRSESDNAVERKLSDSASTRSSSVVHKGKALHAHPYCRKSLKEQKEKYFNRWRISLTDARLLRSLLPIIEDLRETFETVYSQLRRRGSLHVDICAAAALGGRNVQGAMSSRTNHVHRSTLVDSKYKDIFKEAGLANKYDDWDDGPTPSAVTLMWDCPKIDLGDDYQTCIIEMIVNEQRREPLGDAYFAGKPLQDAASIELLADAFWAAQYESGEDSWSDLRWCRVERCPKIHTVFRTPKGSKNLHGCRFPNLRTFWASQLLTARYVWSWSTATSHPDAYYSFHDLGFLHLDYCPRLVHVLPVQVHMSYSLRTIEIVYCGDLTEIFPLHMHDETQGQSLEMPRLERIHLCKLPKLQHICGLKLTAPMLKTVKIRGCWSLKRLPAISYYTEPPKVDCKKEWWDSLDWDGLEANHHPSLYKPTHSAYYKKRLARGSLLR